MHSYVHTLLIFPWFQWDPGGGVYRERENETPALTVPIITALSIKIFAFDFQECFSKA